MILFMRESSRFSFTRANIERRRSISSSLSSAMGDVCIKSIICRFWHHLPRRSKFQVSPQLVGLPFTP